MPARRPPSTVFPLYCVQCGLPRPVAELRFAAMLPEPRQWRFDWAWPHAAGGGVALEVEGGVWLSKHGKKSRHFTGSGILKDMEKYNTAASLGWTVLRCTPDQLTTLATIQLVKTTLALRA